MKISYNWLSEFVDIKKIKPELLANQITEHCFEVEKVSSGSEQDFKFSQVFVAKVLSFEKHPNADRLRVVKLDMGPGKIVDPVVCGANNFAEGDLVALALPNAVIPQNIHSEQHESFTLGKATIRGVESQGMICAGFELGLAPLDQESGIMILPKTAKVGSKLEDHLSLKQKKSDFIFDLSLPANRPDLFSHLGIARELSGLLHLKKLPLISTLEKKDKLNFKTKKKLELDLRERELCSYYLGAKIKVKINESPRFILDRLESLGLRPINNVVDITNYVMHEVGEPLHAFDSKFVSGGIIIRKAHPQEEIVTLDHKKRVLEHDMLVIADSHKPLAIAGIMGGKESEINSETQEIILEAATFNGGNIRKTSKHLGLRTEASALWEKGLHTRQAVIAMNRAIELLKEHASGEVLEFAEAGKAIEEKKSIRFSNADINSLLGTSLTPIEIKKSLTQVGFKVEGTSSLRAEIPYYRTEIYNSADLADEVLKITGTNNLEKQPLVIQKLTFEVNQNKFFNEAKAIMVGFGFNEVQNYSFISEDDINKSGKEGENRHLKIKNPLSGEQEFLKRTLLIPIVKNIRDNSRYLDAFKLFEMGKGYMGFLNEVDLLTFAIYDKNISKEMLLAKAKGYLEEFIGKYHREEVKYRSLKGSAMTVSSGNVELGSIALVENQMMRNFDLENPAVYATLDLQKLSSSAKPTYFHSYSKFPEKVLDISLIVEKDLDWSKIVEVIKQYAGSLLKGIQVFEAEYFYPQGKLPDFHRKLAEKNQKNIAFHMIFQAENMTLKDSEISPIYDKIVGELQSKLNAEIR
jgi:phenylalanyl-tRNA synthetase beta chain